MNSFMLWWEEKKITLDERISKACAYYLKKYKVMPNCIEVNPGELVGVGKIKHKGMTIRTNTYVVPGCLFVGVDD